MEQTNHWYGHSHLLARYCGLDVTVPPQIWGALQHGWNIEHGFGPNHYPYAGFPRLVWSDIAVRRGQSRGWRDMIVIGAPWAYLLTMSPPPPSERSGTIFYPFHTWDRSSIEGDHTQLIREIRDHEDGEVTVCLYWMEYDDPEIRGHYEDAGFRVICHGRRGRTRNDADPDFLVRQRDELMRHRRVASNRLTTAILYGASVGCEAGVYGDPMRYWESAPDADHEDSLERGRRMYPELYRPEIDPAFAAAFAREELGLGRIAAPGELREILGWTA